MSGFLIIPGRTVPCTGVSKPMSPMATSWVVFACVSGGALLGTRLARVLPENYLIESKEVRGLTMGLVATMSALVLALLVSSAKDSFDSQKNGVTQLAASFVLLDRVLTEYGPETSQARAELHTVAVSAIDQLWASHSVQSQRATRANVNDLLDQIRPFGRATTFNALFLRRPCRSRPN